jgi:transposase
MRGCLHGRQETDASEVHRRVQTRRCRAVRSSGRLIKQVAAELGVYDSTLGNWVKQDRIDRGEREGLTSDERARLRELERENARLRMERDLLKRATAFWVRESTQ